MYNNNYNNKVTNEGNNNNKNRVCLKHVHLCMYPTHFKHRLNVLNIG